MYYQYILEIQQLHNLERLNMSSNRLSCLPKEFFKCTNLQSCDLDNNSLHHMPIDIVRLKKLTDLSMSSNQIPFPSLDMSRLEGLECVDLYDNPLLCSWSCHVATNGDLLDTPCGVSKKEIIRRVKQNYDIILAVGKGEIAPLVELAARTVYKAYKEDTLDNVVHKPKLRWIWERLQCPPAYCFHCENPIFSWTVVVGLSSKAGRPCLFCSQPCYHWLLAD